ncbi:RNA polymerase sigma factor, RpoD/SigA family [Kovacikia minuta CCNUW1]|uniref:RNA polymerase sigma factor, RpoD/SigA family n=1 Tax=Kovacikia minuta TaxID=2931930 RepID=UPI001CCDCEB3|nr:RNA polymerase sigma factor, RpoD/SigA family [Kovacikia minuta]UBF29577.1 RNA polymerase sigma factor, RpoD/SigA family [Kovacikia minuta CCNUW1]
MFRTYLLEIGRIPLLTKEQEVIFGQQVQQMMHLYESRESLMQSLGQAPDNAEWAQKAGLDEAKLHSILQVGKRAKHRMIESNLRLVVSVAKKYQNCNVEFLDLIQEGNLGLERGVEKFDPQQGFRLSTYVYWWIRQGITRAIAMQGRTIRLPIHICDRLTKIRQTQRQLFHSLGRSATQSEIAQALSLETAEVRKLLLLSRQPVSLDLRVGETQESELVDLLKDDGLSPEEYTTSEALRLDIQQLLAELTPRQRDVVTLRFGLENTEIRSLQEVGDQLGISRERVRQIEQKALMCLRRHRAKVREYLVI